MNIIINPDIELLYRYRKYYVSYHNSSKLFMINESINAFIEFVKNSEIREKDKIIENFLSTNNIEKSNIALSKQIEQLIESLLELNVFINDEEKTIKYHTSCIAVNQIIGDYKIIKIIRVNNITTVCEIENIKNNAQLVGKFFNLKKDDENFDLIEYSKLKSEYNFQSNFRKVKPICTVHSFHEIDNIVFFVMEHLKGITISKYVKVKEIKETKRKQLINQLIYAFNKIHQQEIIYGDLNFYNVMVVKSNIKLIDFGFAYKELNQLTIHGGISYFTPPERLNDNNYNFSSNFATYQSDVYQIGIIIYYIYFKKIPFKGALWKDMRKSIENYSVSRFLKKEVMDANMKIILEKCLDKDLNIRYKNAAELYKDYKKLIKT